MSTLDHNYPEPPQPCSRQRGESPPPFYYSNYPQHRPVVRPELRSLQISGERVETAEEIFEDPADDPFIVRFLFGCIDVLMFAGTIAFMAVVAWGIIWGVKQAGIGAGP